MEERTRMEARVWARVMGQDAPEQTETEELLRMQCCDLAVYRALRTMLPHARQPVLLMEAVQENIRYLKARFFLETGRKWCFSPTKPPCFCDVCQVLRHQYRRLETQTLPELEENRKKQRCLLQCLLQQLL